MSPEPNRMTPIHESSLYNPTCLRRKLCLPFSAVSNFSRVEDYLLKSVSNDMDGRCITEGFVEPGSCKLRSYSVGTFSAGNIKFDLDIECMMCCPKEGTVIKCTAKTVTQAGIRAHAAFMTPSPVVVYVSREMYDATRVSESMPSQLPMDSVKPGDVMHIRVVGRRFELNDKQVSIIGEWIMHP